MRTQLPLPKKDAERPPRFSAHVHCGQTAGWINMALGTEVGLGLRHIVLNVEPAPLTQKGDRAATKFWPTSVVAKLLHGLKCCLVRR